MTLATLDDVRELIETHLPAHFRDKRSWRHVAAELDKAAAGGDAADVAIALRMALSLEGGECSRSDAYLVGSASDSVYKPSLGVFHFEQTLLDNARQIFRLNRIAEAGAHDSAEE
jgi:hypothetical protein